jgi:amino acid adenylation domain-containing protein/non-ribosomal peptide synthase protein (TIGR01720 family)
MQLQKMLRYNSIAEVLIERSVLDDIGITFIKTNDQDEFLSYKGLLAAGRNMLAFLQEKGMRPKDELVFQLDDNKTFLIVFWACLLGGIIPIPLSLGHNDDHKEKLFNVWRILKAPWLLITANNFDKFSAFVGKTELEDLYKAMQARIVDPATGMSYTGECEIFQAGEDDIAFVQFSSGSTGKPKGVVLTNRNLIVNLGAISAAAAYSSRDRMMSWMPLTHDMGLIGFHLNPLFEGINQCLIPTDLFIRRPALWPGKASEYKASILCSPNFGYEYILKNCPHWDEYDWDLSHVRIIYNGAEPISARLCDEFLTTFSRYGLKRNAMCPVYGLAEATLAVSMSGLEDEVMAMVSDEKNSGSFVNLGRPVDLCSVRISVDIKEVAPAAMIGHIQIKGDNVTGGYYNDEKATKEAITPDGWLRTGDLGFMKDGSLYVTGRAKDIIFINGQNYYPHDIERVAAEMPGIGLNRVAVAGFFDAESQKEEIVAFVLHRSAIDTFTGIASSLRALINSKVGVEISRVLPVKHIPKTTSGKLQRFKLLELLRNGAFGEVEQLMNENGIRPAGKRAADNPADEQEQRLINIWKTLLGRADIGIEQNFFELGGNSLKAAELSMILWKEFQAEIPMETIYEKQTIKALSVELNVHAQHHYKPIPVVGKLENYPASTAQKGLCYFWDMNRGSNAYNIPVAVKINGNIEREVLENCIKQLIHRHDSLRMSFHAVADPIFLVHDSSNFSLEYLPCCKNELDEKLRTLVRPFDLGIHPLFRIYLLQVADQEYVLFMDFHHIISDGISIYQFLDELLRLYGGNELPALRTQFSDYACWHKENIKEEPAKCHEAYWLRQLEGELPLLNLPLDFPRPPVFDTEGAKLAFAFDPETSNRLRQLAGLQGGSLHTLLFAIYSVFLSKYTGQDDIIIGIPVAGRRHPDLLQVHGMFVNNLAVRTVVSGEESFTGFLQRMIATIREAIAHQDYPFEDLIRRIGARRDIDRNPVFDTMFVYQNMGRLSPGETTFTISRHFFDPGVSKFDLSLEVFENDEAIQYYFEYATTLFSRPTIVTMARYFGNLVQRVIADPGCRVADLSVLADEEYRHFIENANRKKTNYPKEKTIHRLFEEQSMRTPDNIALEFNGRMMTYGELNEKANRLADVLRKRGIERGSIVGLFIRRRPELIIGILGILKAGACYLPIDADQPLNRIGYIVSNSRCELLIAGEGTIGRLDGHFPAIEILAVDKPGLLESEASGSLYKSSPGDLAYIMYTSGTSGSPKGVMVEHQSVSNYICWAAAAYLRGEKMAFPLHTSVSFDLTVTSIYVPLVTGNKIVIYEEDERELAIEKVMADNLVDIIKLTPSHLKLMRENSAFSISAGSRVRRLIVGGEVLETPLARDISDKFDGHIEIYNEYGPTEATVGCMIHRYEKGLELSYVPIGIAADNSAVYLLDAFLKPVPPGANGEIYISGDGIARGYLFNEELTARKFMTDPFCPGQRMYKTGDIARQLPDGSMVFIGRIDEQIKINGHRIEPGEIRNCLINYPGITEAVVVPRRTKNGQQTLHAYYRAIAAFPEGLETAGIRKHLASMLPYYMIPSKLIRVDHYPLTKNGKIDYNALPVAAEDDETAGNTDPQNRISEIMLETWKTVFDNEKVTIRDSFIGLGGDSIKAIQLASRLAAKGIAVASKDILTYHTIEQISDHARVAGKINTYNQGTITGQRGLSPIECWFFTQRFADPGYFNQSVLLELNKPVDTALLEQAFERLIAHHDGLRTNYAAQKGVLYYNSEHLNKRFTIEVVDYGKEPYDVIAVFRTLKTRFNLAADLLLKVILIKGERQKAMLRITLHHLLVDGISWRILLEDLYAIYGGLERHADIELPLKTASVGEWQANRNASVVTEQSKTERAYWAEVDRFTFTLRQDFEPEDRTTEHRRTMVDILSHDRTGFLLKEAHHVYDTDVPILLNTALASALREFTGLDCFVVEQENNGRYPDTCDTSRTIGWFTAMYPVKLLVVDDDPGNRIIAIKEQLRGVPGNGIGYGLYKYGGEPLIQRKKTPVRFNYLGEFGRELENDLFSYCNRLPVSDIGATNEMTALLELNAMVINGVLRLEIHYSRQTYKETTIKGIMDSFFENLVQIIDHIRHENSARFKASAFEAVDLDDQELDELFL